MVLEVFEAVELLPPDDEFELEAFPDDVDPTAFPPEAPFDDDFFVSEELVFSELPEFTALTFDEVSELSVAEAADGDGEVDAVAGVATGDNVGIGVLDGAGVAIIGVFQPPFLTK